MEHTHTSDVGSRPGPTRTLDKSLLFPGWTLDISTQTRVTPGLWFPGRCQGRLLECPASLSGSLAVTSGSWAEDRSCCAPWQRPPSRLV